MRHLSCTQLSGATLAETRPAVTQPAAAPRPAADCTRHCCLNAYASCKALHIAWAMLGNSRCVSCKRCCWFCAHCDALPRLASEGFSVIMLLLIAWASISPAIFCFIQQICRVLRQPLTQRTQRCFVILLQLTAGLQENSRGMQVGQQACFGRAAAQEAELSLQHLVQRLGYVNKVRRFDYVCQRGS